MCLLRSKGLPVEILVPMGVNLHNLHKIRTRTSMLMHIPCPDAPSFSSVRGHLEGLKASPAFQNERTPTRLFTDSEKNSSQQPNRVNPIRQ